LAVGHEVVVLGGGLLGLAGTRGALAPEKEAQGSEAEGCDADTAGVDAGFCARGESFPLLACGLLGLLVQVFVGG
jgi:hypothetical protein